MSILCGLATSVWELMALRFLQGLGGGTGSVIASAIVRDRHQGAISVRVFSLMMAVTGIAPIVAPLLGAAVLATASWRTIFVVLSILGAFILAATLLGLAESLPRGRRQGGALTATTSVLRGLTRDRQFVAFVLASALSGGALFAYIAGSPFVLQERYGLSPGAFGVVFAINSAGVVLASVTGHRLVGLLGPRRLLLLGLAAGCAGSAALLLAVMLEAGLPAVLPSLFVAISSGGLVFPSATALGLEHHPDVAGSTSALLGVIPYAVGALAAPLVGVGGAANALPLAVVLGVLQTAALAQYVLLLGTRGRGIRRRAGARR